MKSLMLFFVKSNQLIKKGTFLFVILFALFACDTDNPNLSTETEEVVKMYEIPDINPFESVNYATFTDPLRGNSFALTIDGEPVELQGDYVFGYFLCNEHIGFTYYDRKFSLELNILTDGTVREMKLRSYTGDFYAYKTPQYIPAKAVMLKDLEFSKDEYARTEFKGYLYSVIDTSRILVQGKFDITEFGGGSCDPTPYIKLDDNFYFDAFGIGRVTIHSSPHEIYYYAKSYDGYYLNLGTFNEQLFYLPIGIYDFDESSEIKMDFKKYIGPISVHSQTDIKENEWVNYTTSGSYTIQSHEMTGNKKITKGKINMRVYDGDNLIYTFSDAEFEITD